jgi:hypothetical protein
MDGVSTKRQTVAAYQCLILALYAGTFGAARAQPTGGATSQDAPVTITLVERNVTDKLLQLRYQIRNSCDHDIWICESMDAGWVFEARVGREDQTLVIERHLDIPATKGRETWPTARYIRLDAGATRTETMSLRLPVRNQGWFFAEKRSGAPEQAERLVLLIGYFEEDVPALFARSLIRPAQSSDREIFIGYDARERKKERTLAMTVDDVVIPYATEYVKAPSIHLSPLKQIKIHFAQSPLEFFFPCAEQQALLSPKERQSLQSLKDFVLEDRWDLMGIAYDASEAVDGAFFTQCSRAELTCYRKDSSVVRLTVYDDVYLVTPEGRVFRCLDGLTRLRMLTPQIRSLDARVRCAATLKGLWHSFRSYYLAGYARPDRPGGQGPRGWTYPPAREWCDALGKGEHVCPAAGEGKCHYAMNPNCGYDSPADMVLLFETKAGWNQHGGPELFAFGNHRPKGGCVLLRDGTVKFIRTPAELRRLRWK